MNQYERWLRYLMYLNGLVLLFATPAVFLPALTMASWHQWLGLGEFPDSRITIYLARSTALLYAVHGAVAFYVAWKWNSFRELVPLLAGLHVLMGLTLIGIDWTTGMPSYWTLLEGGPIACFGLFLLWLYRHSGIASNPC